MCELKADLIKYEDYKKAMKNYIRFLVVVLATGILQVGCKEAEPPLVPGQEWRNGPPTTGTEIIQGSSVPNGQDPKNWVLGDLLRDERARPLKVNQNFAKQICSRIRGKLPSVRELVMVGYRFSSQ